MNFLLQCLMVLFLFVLSIPLHELGHLLGLRLIGCTTKFKVGWLVISRKRWIGGFVRPADGTGLFEIPDFWKRCHELPVFLIFLLGGWSVAFLFFGLSHALITHFSYGFSLWRTPLLIVGAFQFIYGLREAIRGTAKVQLV